MYVSEIRPYWLLSTKGYGFTVKDIDSGCPSDFEPYSKAFKLEQKLKDEENWTLGIYIQSAVSVAIEHNLAGQKAVSEYIKKPLLETANEKKSEETQEDADREIQKMIFADDRWIANLKRKGLQETIIN